MSYSVRHAVCPVYIHRLLYPSIVVYVSIITYVRVESIKHTSPEFLLLVSLRMNTRNTCRIFIESVARKKIRRHILCHIYFEAYIIKEVGILPWACK